jgi:hypothetical protein
LSGLGYGHSTDNPMPGSGYRRVEVGVGE